ncbi:hypothetical protein [Arenibaculum pallidiluteum]|uniref:hypothetical protein n=1 Tax=Arenibaculum pallidiluteum TaxID=2812559 RepID=UPI001A958C2D|nr:hypothetical protein [Arenibaculum pallidiluteum]
MNGSPDGEIDEIERLRHELALEKARVAGLRAQVAAAAETVARHAPELAAETEARLRGDGPRKSAWRLIYDRAFDAAARRHGIARPEDWRD